MKTLKTIEEKQTLIDTLKKRRWPRRHTLRHGDELQSLIIEGMIDETLSRGRPRAKYISQVMEVAGVTSYMVLKNMVNDRENGENICREKIC